MRLNKDKRQLNCPYLKNKLNEEINLKGYTDAGATISLISDVVLSEQQLKALRKYNGNIKDANGNPIDILGELQVIFKIKNEIIYEKLLVFKKTSAIVHVLLIGMNIFEILRNILYRKKCRFQDTERKRL